MRLPEAVRPGGRGCVSESVVVLPSNTVTPGDLCLNEFLDQLRARQCSMLTGNSIGSG